MRKISAEEQQKRIESGKRLKKFRNIIGITQLELAQQIGKDSSTGKSYISKVEKGDYPISPQHAQAFAKYMNQKIAEKNLYEKEDFKCLVQKVSLPNHRPYKKAEDAFYTVYDPHVIDWRYLTGDIDSPNEEAEYAAMHEQLQEYTNAVVHLLARMGYYFDVSPVYDSIGEILEGFFESPMTKASDEFSGDYEEDGVSDPTVDTDTCLTHDGKAVKLNIIEIKRLFTDIYQMLDLRLTQAMNRNPSTDK